MKFVSGLKASWGNDLAADRSLEVRATLSHAIVYPMSPQSGMKRQVGLFPFRTGDLWVKGELLGASWVLERDDYGLVVSLPSHQSDFRIAPPGEKRLFKVGVSRGDEIIAATIQVFQVAVWLESEATVDLFPPDPRGLDGQRALTKASKTAIAVAEDFLAWLRVLGGQYWLGASHEPIRPAGTADLIDLESGLRIKNINWEYGVSIYGLSEEVALGPPTLETIVGCLDQGQVVRESDVLLADARHALGDLRAETTISASRRDVRRCVLLAAIASEMKIRDTLREKTPPSRKDLVDLILKNWREVDIAIAQLPHQAMKAAIGRSLHEEQPDLFKGVEKLFKTRNDVAHRGEAPSLQLAQEAVDTAIRLGVWLDSLAMPVE